MKILSGFEFAHGQLWPENAGVKVSGMFGGIGSLFIGFYFVVIVAVAALVIWVLILAITFLRLRIEEIRGANGPGAPRN